MAPFFGKIAFVSVLVLYCALFGVNGRYRRSNGMPCKKDDLLNSAEAFEKEEETANMVFTGTVERVYRPAPVYTRSGRKNDVTSRGTRSWHSDRIYRGAVRVKRVLKGDRNLAENTVIVEGFGDPALCASDVREKDTRIFMVKQGGNGRLRLSSSLLRLSLTTLDRTIAAVKGKSHVQLRLTRSDTKEARKLLS